MITVKELSQNQLKPFVKFPFTLYKGNKYWVPPIIAEEIAFFNSNKNPVFKHATARFFIAEQNHKIVGRVVAIINQTETKQQNIKKMRFGWFDFIDNYNVFKALLKKVEEIGKEHNLEFMEGPVGFSNLDKVGVLTYGFKHLGTMITWYNHPYYKTHYEKYGFKVEKEYLENKFKLSDANPAIFQRMSPLIQKRYQLKILNFSKTKEIMPYVNEMFELFNTSYASLESFVPISEVQKEYFKKKYISFINPEFIKFVVDKDHKIIAFAIAMPSFSRALQKANGKLFPFGIFHLLKAKRKVEDIIFYLIGVNPSYQNKGVTAIIFEEFYKTMTSKGIVNCIRTPELTTNTAIAGIWKNFNQTTHKKRCTYKKDL